MPITIQSWDEAHPRWQDLFTHVTTRENNIHTMTDDAPVPFYAAVALDQDQIIGYHVFLIQPIGPEMDVRIITHNGTLLQEAKIRTLRVEDAYQNQGIGTRLQQQTLKMAADLGCWQMRSRSAIDRAHNYRIKIKLGFAAHPHLRTYKDGTKKEGVYWVKRLN